ncbi:hypothetical protein BDV40DRAFT_302344 [Aspergillus tamarii]|uniref:Nephrocystin 3-like N-terminal domain-containing protein n=1 Tax=Aspergillus tamarii TaxID=41984 RepID=A0A5N6UPK7_ASPTM|nr:hypothetical protein BDV40DRAFT_302344 [Aspergillus tamarii]
MSSCRSRLKGISILTTLSIDVGSFSQNHFHSLTTAISRGPHYSSSLIAIRLVPNVLNAVKDDPNILSKFLREQFDKLLYQPLLKLTPHQATTIVVVIDTLDECDREDDIGVILQLLFKLHAIKSVYLRVFLASRPELPIRHGFKQDRNHQDLVLHKLPTPVIEQDIRVFLEYKLSHIQEEQALPSNWPGKGNIEKLVNMAVPLFIFAATLCRFVGNRDWLPEERLAAVLQDEAATATSDMDRTYIPVLNQLCF